MTWRQYIEKTKKEWIGKKVKFEGKPFTVVDVDMNGILHIDRPTEYNMTTAVYEPHEAKKFLIEEG